MAQLHPTPFLKPNWLSAEARIFFSLVLPISSGFYYYVSQMQCVILVINE